jgi:MinD-like ATPase involved in chromosome partitioning or flagellar assembly
VSAVLIVASASADGARQAARTVDWLRHNGCHELLARACVIINNVVPGKPSIDVGDLVHQFSQYLGGGRVVVLPWDRHVAAGTEIQFDLLSQPFRRSIVELAAALLDGFDGHDNAVDT